MSNPHSPEHVTDGDHPGIEPGAVTAVLQKHRDSGITPISEGCGDDEHTVGAQAWCYCGDTRKGLDWIEEGPIWRGTFNVPHEVAERELCEHFASAILPLFRGGDDRDPKTCTKCGEMCTYDGWAHVHASGLALGSCSIRGDK